MKKFFTTILLIMVVMTTWAYDAEVDGIYYNLVSKVKTAEVTYKGATYSEVESYSGSVTIPETIEVEGVTYDVTSIGKWAFGVCSGLTSVTIPNSVTSIDMDAFSGCSGLTSVTIPNSVTSIGNAAFDGCSSLTSITIPNSVTSIGACAFEYTGLTSLDIPNSVTSIGGAAFFGCVKLESVSIPNSVQNIDKYAFMGCEALKSVIIPNSITNIVLSTFSGCTALTSVTIPNSVKSIEYGAFGNCTNLTSVTIPNSVTSIGPISFYNCSNLTSLNLGVGVISIDYEAFENCTSLTSVTIPNSVSIIGHSVFKGCTELKYVRFGSSVTSIGKNAVANCKNLDIVTCYADNAPSMGSDVFENSYVSYATLKVPASSVEAYKAADQWKDFGTITAIEGTAYKLIYKVDGAVYKEYTVYEGATITPEAAPTKEGYTFSGWDNVPATMPANDVTVSGTFKINQYTITFDTDGGNEIAPIKQDYATAVTKPADPTKTGYTFTGWDKEIPATIPAENITIKALWKINSYKFTYKVDGETYKEYTIEYGAKITPEAEPTKVGYKFSGWSTIPETMPANDVEVTGTFTQETVAIKVSEDVEIKVGDKEATDEQKKAVAEILNNSTVTSMTISEMGLDKAIKADENYVYNITLSLASANLEEGNAVYEMVFEVKPMKTKKADATTSEIPNSDINGDITFRLPVQKSATLANAKVSHEGTEMGLVPVKTAENGDKYIEVTTNSFSKFGYVLTNETTGINSIAEDSADSPIYNISGQCAKATDKGILIKNGKKYIRR